MLPQFQDLGASKSFGHNCYRRVHICKLDTPRFKTVLRDLHPRPLIMLFERAKIHFQIALVGSLPPLPKTDGQKSSVDWFVWFQTNYIKIYKVFLVVLIGPVVVSLNNDAHKSAK